jgi:phosphatidylglycerophosphate synthase
VSGTTTSSTSRRRPLSLSEQERRQAVKPVDAWWTVLVVDPVVLRVLPLVRNVRWVTPTGVTVAGGAFGVLAIVLFLTGHPVLAGISYELRFLLDCLDGKLARLRGTTSSFGAMLDVLLDVVLTTIAYGVVAELTTPELATTLVGLSLFEAWARERRAAAAAGKAAGKAAASTADASPAKPRRTRLAIAPSTVDVESLALFVFPVVAWQYEDVAVYAAIAVLGLVCLDHLRVVLTAAWRGQR